MNVFVRVCKYVYTYTCMHVCVYLCVLKGEKLSLNFCEVEISIIMINKSLIAHAIKNL